MMADMLILSPRIEQWTVDSPWDSEYICFKMISVDIETSNSILSGSVCKIENELTRLFSHAEV